MTFNQYLEKIFKTNNGYVLFSISLLFLEVPKVILYFICPCILGEPACDVQYYESKRTLGEIFLITVVYGPLLETLIFQYAIFEIFIQYIKIDPLKINLLALTFSALLFGISHSYNILTIINGLLAGIVYAGVYLFQRERANNPYLFTFFLHGLSNFISFLMNEIFKIT